MERIAAHAARRGIRTRSTAELGIDPGAKESLLFALIGFCTWHGVPLAIGPTPARIAGRITPAPGRPLRMPEPLPGIASLEVADAAAPAAAASAAS
ncbi:hypothetical protein [Agromyces archimandritae]|uniref:hypothetical protein n=1 Tax=Agromyces archimandritae TaxID=2781962 RepID=UPI003CC8099E